jgi:antagonist of KipI
MLTTVQDLGRWGHQHLGVPVAGPMDWWSHEAANRLAGNDRHAAVLEITLIGPELEFSRDAIAAVTGATFELTVSGRSVVMHEAFAVRAGERLTFGVRASGARAYLEVDGGFDVPEVLGSRATHVKAGLGGHAGRPLRRGDVVPLGPGRWGAGAVRAVPPPYTEPPPHVAVSQPSILRAVPGPEPVDPVFWQSTFVIGNDSDRMGYRLAGPALDVTGSHLSAGVAMGTVQVTPSGTIVLLMADRATSGGYARAATVITADLPRAGQLAPGDHVAFVPVDTAAAEAALAELRVRLPEARA